MIGNPFISVELKKDEVIRDLAKRRIRTFLSIGGQVTLSEWERMSNDTHEIIDEVAHEIQAEQAKIAEAISGGL